MAIDPRDEPAVDGARAWLNEHRIRPLEVEACLVNETAGTCDPIAELDDATISAVVASLGSGPRPVTLDRARIERQIRELALEHAAGRLEDAVYLRRLHELRDAKENLERTSADGISPERAVAWLRALAATWRGADVPEATAHLLHAIYDRIVVTGRSVVSVRLTASAYAHGLALALPDKVAMARPTGVGRAIATCDMPIEGRDEWIAAVERLA